MLGRYWTEPSQSGPDPDPSDYTNGSLTGDQNLLGMFGKNDKKDQGTGIGVNAFLWRGALDTLGFMPLTSADPFGGVIITDWYTAARRQRRTIQDDRLHPDQGTSQRRRADQHFPAAFAERPVGRRLGEQPDRG